jgi:Leucine-rich repeat (LRR) protein
MGSSSSKSKVPKKSVETKLHNASRTGILNLEDLDLKPQSQVWAKLITYSPDFASTIKVLTLSDNDLKTIPAEVHELVNLRKLYATRCSLQRMHNSTGFTRLTHAVLDNNDLEETSIGQFPISLNHLNLSYNHLTIFPETLYNLINLYELDLSSNRLISTVGIGTLIKLQELKLDDNLIEELDDEIGNLTQLKYLSIKRNSLAPKTKDGSRQSMPAALFTNTILDHLELAGNGKLSKNIVLKFEGIDSFLVRRQATRVKNFNTGAMVDHSVFGLD